MAAECFGVLTLAELLACGLTRREVEVRVAQGHLHRIHRGVYAVGHAGLTQEGVWLAAVKAAGPGALLSHTPAALHYGIVEGESHVPVVTVRSRRTVQGVRVRRTRDLHPLDEWRHRGIPITTPERVVMDLAATYTDGEVRRAMSRAQSLKLTNTRRLAALLDRTSNRPGRARYARVLAAAPPNTRSELEDRVFDLIMSAGFRRPDVNVPLHLDGRRVIPDFRWPEQRLVVEADGGRWHDNPQARAEDAERRALLEAHGDRVLRVDWPQATRGAAATAARLSARGAPR
jgi:very-short-patch-repair endonuclease/predicted transcriptional regulator of viral defense system